MKKSSLFTAGLCLLGVVIAPLNALAEKAQGPKAKLMAKYDKNGNGVIDGDELAAVRKDFAAEPAGELKRFDTNKDGKLSDAEIGEMKAPGAKGKDGEKAKGKAKDKETKAPEPKETDATKDAAK